MNKVDYFVNHCTSTYLCKRAFMKTLEVHEASTGTKFGLKERQELYVAVAAVAVADRTATIYFLQSRYHWNAHWHRACELIDMGTLGFAAQVRKEGWTSCTLDEAYRVDLHRIGLRQPLLAALLHPTRGDDRKANFGVFVRFGLGVDDVSS